MLLEPPTVFDPPPPMQVADTSDWELIDWLKLWLGVNDTFLDRFYEKFVQGEPSECWPWLGAIVDGYGYIGANGKYGKNLRANRVIYTIKNGAIPNWMLVCHSCDTRNCMNHNHLFLGTEKDNSQDMVSKGRHAEQKVTHCPQGHEYNEANTRVNPRGNRDCRVCDRMKKAGLL